MKSSKRSVKLAMRSRRSSKLHVMVGGLDVIEEGAWADRRGGRIALLIESEDSNIVAIVRSKIEDILIINVDYGYGRLICDDKEVFCLSNDQRVFIYYVYEDNPHNNDASVFSDSSICLYLSGYITSSS